MILESFFLPRLDLLSFIFVALSVVFFLIFLSVFSEFFDIAEVLPARAGSSGSDLGHSLRFSVLFSLFLLVFFIFASGFLMFTSQGLQNESNIVPKTRKERREEREEQRRERRERLGGKKWSILVTVGVSSVGVGSQKAPQE